jgi:hypothetical protein
VENSDIPLMDEETAVAEDVEVLEVTPLEGQKNGSATENFGVSSPATSDDGLLARNEADILTIPNTKIPRILHAIFLDSEEEYYRYLHNIQPGSFWAT